MMRLFLCKKSGVAFPQRHFNPNTNRVIGKIVMLLMLLSPLCRQDGGCSDLNIQQHCRYIPYNGCGLSTSPRERYPQQHLERLQ